jgi:putative ABC transport system permease protein
MLNYYLTLAWRSIGNQSGISFLISSTLGLGIAACTITFSLIYLMSADPLPGKSQRVFRVQVDNWDPNVAAVQPDLPPEEATWHDSINLVKAGKAKYQSASSITWGMITPKDKNITPFLPLIRVTNGDFFSIFRLPFLYGQAWSNFPVGEAEYITVISKETNERLFAGENSVGKTIPMLGHVFTVVGVLDDWNPALKYYDLSWGPFYKPEDVYIPFELKSTFELPHGGLSNCWGTDRQVGYSAFLNSECINFQIWIELEKEEEHSAYSSFLDNYVEEQKKLGRFPRPLNNRLMNLTQWLEYKNIVKTDMYLFFWLSVLFLLVCVFNTASLLSTSFIGKRSEMALRRALGASQKNILMQCLVETLLLGIAGGIIGLALSIIGLEGIKLIYPNYKNLVRLDATLVFLTMAFSLLSSVFASAIPIIKVCQLPPAEQLK